MNAVYFKFWVWSGKDKLYSIYVCTADLNTWIEPLSDAAAMLCAESQNVIVFICPPCLLYVNRDRLVALRPSSLPHSHILTVPSLEHVAKYVWSLLTRTLQRKTKHECNFLDGHRLRKPISYYNFWSDSKKCLVKLFRWQATGKPSAGWGKFAGQDRRSTHCATLVTTLWVNTLN